MKSVLIGMITLALMSCHGVAPAYANSITVENNRIHVKENGVTRDYGSIRKVREKNGTVEIYTNKNYNKPAVSFNSRGSVTTQEFAKSTPKHYVLENEVEDEDDE